MSVSPSPGTGAVATCLLALLLARPGRDNPAGAIRFRPCGSPESHPLLSYQRCDGHHRKGSQGLRNSLMIDSCGSGTGSSGHLAAAQRRTTRSAREFFLGEIMFRSFIVAAIANCLVSAGMATGRASTPPSAWFVDSLIKVFPGDARGTHSLRAPEFRGARNQHLAVQLALRASNRLPDVMVEVAPIEGGTGRRISSVEVHHVAYVVV